jgi:hypothetical protein
VVSIGDASDNLSTWCAGAVNISQYLAQQRVFVIGFDSIAKADQTTTAFNKGT